MKTTMKTMKIEMTTKRMRKKRRRREKEKKRRIIPTCTRTTAMKVPRRSVKMEKKTKERQRRRDFFSKLSPTTKTANAKDTNERMLGVFWRDG